MWISQSSDVFSNLALEDWLYRHHDFEHKRLLLLWRNDPCVVIGRHQNPWTEADVPYLRGSFIDLARRCLNYENMVLYEGWGSSKDHRTKVTRFMNVPY